VVRPRRAVHCRPCAADFCRLQRGRGGETAERWCAANFSADWLLLQRGRGGETAERWIDREDSSYSFCCFNGAAVVRPRRARLRHPHGVRLRAASTGAAVVRPRRARPDSCRPCRPR